MFALTKSTRLEVFVVIWAFVRFVEVRFFARTLSHSDTTWSHSSITRHNKGDKVDYLYADMLCCPTLSQISTLTLLQRLILYKNKLVGPIPASVSDFIDYLDVLST